MRYKRWLMRVGALAGATALWWGAAQCLTPPAKEPETQPLWVLRDAGGLVAQYAWPAAEGDEALQVWPVYTALLPTPDAERLASGIPIYSEEELRRLLEDLGG